MSTVMNNIVETESGVTMLTILLTTMNNVDSKALLNPVSINRQQVGNILPCKRGNIM